GGLSMPAPPRRGGPRSEGRPHTPGAAPLGAPRSPDVICHSQTPPLEEPPGAVATADSGSGRMYHRHVGPSEGGPGLLRPGIVAPSFTDVGGTAIDVVALTALTPTRLIVLTSGDRSAVSVTSNVPPARPLRPLRIGETTSLRWQVD